MIWDIADSFRTLFMGESGETGYLPGLKTVYIGELKTFPDSSLPAIVIEFQKNSNEPTGAGAWENYSFMIYSKFVEQRNEETLKAIGDFIYGGKNTFHEAKGLLPLLNSQNGLECGTARFSVSVGESGIENNLSWIEVNLKTVRNTRR